MGRRIKEPSETHQKNISLAAEKLFMEKGIVATSMDEIAREAKYSKATLYVYFLNKKEIVDYLVLESMKKLYEYICISKEKETMKEKFDSICYALVEYEKAYPFYYNMVINKISINTSESDKLTYNIGEEINKVVYSFFEEAIKKGIIRPNINIIQTIFTLWGMISGVILLASNKEEYFRDYLHFEKKDFLENGFKMIYESLKGE